LSDESVKDMVSPEETGGVLYYLVGSKTDELLNDTGSLEKMGLQNVDREDLYLEITILHMFLVIKQYTAWERDEMKYTKALDQMHFLLFHQLKAYSNYDEDDVQELHRHIFERYAAYGDAIENDEDVTWLKVLAESFLENMNADMEENGAALALISKYAERFYKSIPNILRSM